MITRLQSQRERKAYKRVRRPSQAFAWPHRHGSFHWKVSPQRIQGTDRGDRQLLYDKLILPRKLPPVADELLADRLYIGTASGSLNVYSLTRDQGVTPFTAWSLILPPLTEVLRIRWSDSSGDLRRRQEGSNPPSDRPARVHQRCQLTGSPLRWLYSLRPSVASSLIILLLC